MARINDATQTRTWGRPTAPGGWFIAAFVTLTLWAAPRVVHACESTTVCFEWNTSFTDGGAGEAYLIGDGVPAAGSPVTLIRPPPEAPIATVLEPDGCMTFDTQYAYGHRAVIYGEAVIGGVRVRPGWQDDVFSSNSPPAANYPAYFWEVDIQGLMPEVKTTVSITVEADDPNPDSQRQLTPLLGATAGVLSRFVELDVIPPGAVGTTLEVLYNRTEGGAGCFCDGGDEVLSVGIGASSKKFMIAHELGHWLHAQLVGGPLLRTTDGRDYYYGGAGVNDAIDPPCKFNAEYLAENLPSIVGGHGLRSAEWASAAMIEGFAQFASTFVMNDTTSEDAGFRYYKRIASMHEAEFIDLIMDEYVVEVSDNAITGGQNQWVKTKCPNDWAFDWEVNYPSEPPDGYKDDISGELDWMRFWWRLTTEQSSPAPTLAQVLAFAGDQNWQIDRVWPLFATEVAAPGSALDGFETRFELIGQQEGVNNGL
jgi:hypothetical protein